MSSQVDFLIVGAGPVGLTMANELIRYGHSVRLIEQKKKRDPWSKAAGISSRTVEVLELMGVHKPFLERSVRVTAANILHELDKIGSLRIEPQNTRYNFMMGLEQVQTELILEEALHKKGSQIEREVVLHDFTQDETGVTSILSDKDGQTTEFRSKWLIGCDGAKSTVRHTLQLSFEGNTFEQILVQADVKVDFPFPAEKGEAYLFLSGKSPIGFLPLFREGRYRMIVVGPPKWEGELLFSFFEQLISEQCPPGVRIYDPNWFTHFKFHGRLSSKYRVGRIFLCGDAAHIHSPAGAQGMNLGIQDAFNLAWKLALYESKQARECVLDSYEIERRPVGKMIVETTDQATKTALRALSIQNSIFQAIRNELISFILGSGIPEAFALPAIAGLNVNYRKSNIIGEHRLCYSMHRVWGDRDSEVPTIADAFLFNKAPCAGERVPDLDLNEGTLYESLKNKKHTLFLFDGFADTDEGYQVLESIAQKVEALYSQMIEVILVLPKKEKPTILTWNGSIWYDTDKELHNHFGSHSESLFLIRPDGYVGYRSQPADEESFMLYLQTIFIPQS